MVFKSTLALCPACSCHVRDESVCPHCGEALSTPSTPFRRSAAALAVGLAVAVTAAGCADDVVVDEDDQEQVAAGDDDDSTSSSSWGNSVVATYGVAPSGGWGLGGDDPGFGGMDSMPGQGGAGGNQGGGDEGGGDIGAQGGGDIGAQGGSDGA